MQLSYTNCFIFNFVKNYDKQVLKLKTTLEKLDNRVEILNNLTYERLNNTVQRLCSLDFNLFNYITIIILDNTSTNERLIKTEDNWNVLIESDILTLLKTNSTTANIQSLFVIQKLQDVSTDYKMENVVLNRSKIVQPQYKYENLEFTLRACEADANFQESPFIDVFCEQFLRHSQKQSMPEIYSLIKKETRRRRSSIDIVFGSNQGKNCTGILGAAMDPEIKRDFLMGNGNARIASRVCAAENDSTCVE